MEMSELVKAIGVTAEVTGTTLSAAAAEAMARELREYPPAAVVAALRKCRRELKYRLTLAEVVSRIDDGRPGIEEAWAMLPMTEDQSVVWTEEMAQAFAVALPLIDRDKVAARLAFKEAYTSLVSQAKDERKPVKWTPSLGHDPRGRDGAIQEAIDKGRLEIGYAKQFMLPAPSGNALVTL